MQHQQGWQAVIPCAEVAESASLRCIVADLTVNVPFAKDPLDLLVGPAKLDIMIKDQAGDDEQANQDKQDPQETAQPAVFSFLPLHRP
jgi:hypothetical protein